MGDTGRGGARLVAVALLVLAAAPAAPVASANHEDCGAGGWFEVNKTCVYECGYVVQHGGLNLVSWCMRNNTRCFAVRENVGLPPTVTVLGVTVLKWCEHPSPVVCQPPNAHVMLELCNLPA